MTWLFVAIAILVIGAVFLASMGLLGELPEIEPDLRPQAVQGDVEFDVVVRGYRMDEVDAELARLNGEIDRLSSELSTLEPPQSTADPQ